MVFGADLNLHMPGGLEGVTGPRVHRDAHEESAQHRKLLEDILQFMSQWKLAAINTFPLGEEEATQLWTWTQLKADEEEQEQSGEGGIVTLTLQTAAWVHPRRLVQSDHQQVIAKLKRPQDPCEGNRAGFNLKGWQPQTPMEAVHNRRSCMSQLAPERPLQQMEADFFSNAESGVVEVAMQGSTQRQRCSTGQPSRGGHAWADVSRAKRAGKDPRSAQARAHYLHSLRRVTARQEELSKLKATFREERPHGQPAEGGERGNSRQGTMDTRRTHLLDRPLH